MYFVLTGVQRDELQRLFVSAAESLALLILTRYIVQLSTKLLTLLVVTLAFSIRVAGSGPLGIDHRIEYDDSGIWSRKNQLSRNISLLASWLPNGFSVGFSKRF
jgi:hypothetical protein